ncbi:hypothetical protein B0H16DRAFT_1711142 [Mycena metata]|uniref:Uncharacterized protein n=1 Tax=Mycena metata TaxID=1033252 RepID=A0AAD7NY34_9AGAR|nr:hypothetical protein B0H16DRAFT_1711142 [Mycena metata]
MRDPHDTIVRNALLFPADGSEPCITPMTFNEAGSEANPCGFYTVNVELRPRYGACNMRAVRHMDPKLPVNASMVRIVGVDPKKPGKRPLWRGDVVVVKTLEWPGPIIAGGGAHMDYLDVPPQILQLFTTRLIPYWYNSDRWLNFLEEEKERNEMLLRSGQE